MTRAKGKEKMKWDEQEKVRMKVADQIDRCQGKQVQLMTLPTYQKLHQEVPSTSQTQKVSTMAPDLDKFVKWANELFEVFLEFPIHFTLDQLLSMVPVYKQQIVQKFQAKVAGQTRKQGISVLETYQMIPENVDFRIPTIEVMFNGEVF